MTRVALASAHRRLAPTRRLGFAMLAGAMALTIETVTTIGAFAGPAATVGVPPAGTWLAEDIAGGGVIDRAQTTLTIAADGTVSGSGGCNRYHGKAVVSGAAIQFGPLAATRMACSPALMDQEAKLLGALAAARSWRADDMRHKLELLGVDGSVVARFAAV